MPFLTFTVSLRGGVEDTRLEARAKANDTKKIRGQGQECSRPRSRTSKDTAACVLQKKKVFKKVFQAISNLYA